MLLEASTSTLDAVGTRDTGAFRINASAHAFRILSSGLYSNKIAAVIRELVCNAIDAHRMVGKADIPVAVKLPNHMNNQFYVQDYGPGMSHDFVMRNYTSYFDSTKSHDNSQIGGFGLGSKSPFAYTDQFTVETVQDGVKRTYTAYLDDNGAPCISLMQESETTDPTGTRVTLPVQMKDWNEFMRETQNQLCRMTPLPKIIGSDAIRPMEYTVCDALRGYRKSGPLHSYWSGGLRAVMGGVGLVVFIISLFTL
jgi:hypothetical protein